MRVLLAMHQVSTTSEIPPTGTVQAQMDLLFHVVHIIIIILIIVLPCVTDLLVQMPISQTTQTVGHVMQDSLSSVTSVSGGIISQIFRDKRLLKKELFICISHAFDILRESLGI